MMKSRKPIETLAAALYTALASPEILPDIQYEYQTPSQRKAGHPGTLEKRRPCVDEIEVKHFHQVWGSTALGFGGIGGAAMTGAYTTVVMLGNVAAIFFEGRHAYTVEGFNETFAQDLYKGYMKSVEEIKHYIDGK